MSEQKSPDGPLPSAVEPRPPYRDTLRDLLLLFFKGFAMGAAEVVPGVSGGTIAFITGIYERLLASINNVLPALAGLVKKRDVAAAWRDLDGTFLLTLIGGMAFSIFTLASVIKELLVEQPILIWSFFFGLIVASIAIVTGQIKVWRHTGWLALLVGAMFGSFIVQLVPVEVEATPYLLFFGGALAVCAWILPGLSGSFILLILGLYATVLQAITEYNFLQLGTLALGCVTGLLLFARLLGWMFSQHHNETLGLMCGFMAGSLTKVWPWKHTLSYQMVPDGKQIPLVQEIVMPGTYQEFTGLDPQTLLALLAALSGLLLVLALDRFSRK